MTQQITPYIVNGMDTRERRDIRQDTQYLARRIDHLQEGKYIINLEIDAIRPLSFKIMRVINEEFSPVSNLSAFRE